MFPQALPDDTPHTTQLGAEFFCYYPSPGFDLMKRKYQTKDTGRIFLNETGTSLIEQRGTM